MSFTIQRAIPEALTSHGAGTIVVLPVVFNAVEKIQIGRGGDIVVDDMLVSNWQIVPDDGRFALYFTSVSLYNFFRQTLARTFLLAGRPMGYDVPGRPSYLVTGVVNADVREAPRALEGR
jgi:hypothetical protein